MEHARLNGVPQMSDNCAEILLEKLKESNSYLEWGSGNSTILAVKRAELKKIVSVEHNKRYFFAVLDAILTDLGGSVMSCSLDVFSRDGRFKTINPNDDSLFENYIVGAKTTGLKNVEFNLTAFIFKAMVYKLRRKTKPWQLVRSTKAADASASDLWEEVLNTSYENLEVKIRTKELELRYILSPPENSTYTSDGLASEFHNYINFVVPDGQQYDTVLVDGRARAPCLDRVLGENLVKPGGFVFCHDAWRTLYLRSLLNYPNQKWIWGSNIDLSGNKFAAADEAPLCSSGVKDELFVCELPL